MSAHLRSVLTISFRNISIRGSNISEPLLMFTSGYPFKVQISQGLGQFAHVVVLKSDRGRTGVCTALSSEIVSRSYIYTYTCIYIYLYISLYIYVYIYIYMYSSRCNGFHCIRDVPCIRDFPL